LGIGSEQGRLGVRFISPVMQHVPAVMARAGRRGQRCTSPFPVAKGSKECLSLRPTRRKNPVLSSRDGPCTALQSWYVWSMHSCALREAINGEEGDGDLQTAAVVAIGSGGNREGNT